MIEIYRLLGSVLLLVLLLAPGGTTSTVRVMPTDLLVCLPLVLRE